MYGREASMKTQILQKILCGILLITTDALALDEYISFGEIVKIGVPILDCIPSSFSYNGI